MTADLRAKIQRLIEQRKWMEVRELLANQPAPEVGDLLLEIEEKADRVLLFRVLPRRLAADVFSYLDSTHRDALLRDLTDEETRQLLASLRPDDRTSSSPHGYCGFSDPCLWRRASTPRSCFYPR